MYIASHRGPGRKERAAIRGGRREERAASRSAVTQLSLLI